MNAVAAPLHQRSRAFQKEGHSEPSILARLRISPCERLAPQLAKAGERGSGVAAPAAKSRRKGYILL